MGKFDLKLHRFEVSLGSFVSPELVLGFIYWTCHVGHLPGIDSTGRFQWHILEKRCGVQERRLQRQLRQELESIRRLFEEADAEPWMGKSPLVVWSDEHKMTKWFDVHHGRHVSLVTSF